MSVPKSVVKFDKNGVKYVSSVDRAQYTIRELTRAALRDVGKFLVREINKKAQALPGMKKNPRVRGRGSAFGYWARKQECDLQIGTKIGTWYSYKQELGTDKMPKLGFIRQTTEGNIKTIVEIESQYLSALEDEARALSMIESEDDYTEVDNE
jgi:hypothetical protein